MSVQFLRRQFPYFLAILILSACGGGSGSGGSGSGGSGGAGGTTVSQPPPVAPPVVTHEEPMPIGPKTVVGSNGVSVQMDQSSLRMVGIKGLGIPAANVNFTLSSAPASGTLYAMATADHPEKFTMQVSITSDKTLFLRIIPADLPIGVSSGTFNFKPCPDVNCASTVWSTTMPYQTKMFSVTANSVALSGFQGSQISDKSLVIAPADTLDELRISSTSAPSWLGVRFASKTGLEITADTGNLPVGNYSAHFDLTSIYANPNVPTLMRVGVSLNNGAGMVLPANKESELNAISATTVNDTIALSFNGSAAPAWKAASDRPWLILGTTQGSGAGTVAYTIDHSKLTALDNFSADTAKLTITPERMDAAVVSVTVTKRLPEIAMISPNPLIEGTAGQMRVRGRGLQQLSKGAGISVAGVTGATVTVVSDTEAQLSLPPLTVGTRAVSIPNAAGMPTVGQVLSVVPRTTYTPMLLSTAGKRDIIVFNDARNAIYTIDRVTNMLERYSITTAGIVKGQSVPVAYGSTIGTAINGETLYVVNGGTAFEERSPDTLNLTASYPVQAGLFGGVLQVTNDNRVWLGGSTSYFDTVKKNFGKVSINAFWSGGANYASADGSRMINATDSDWQERRFLRYDPDTGKFELSDASPLGLHDIFLSANGKRFMSKYHAVYDMTTLRALNLGDADFALGRGFLSRDGSRGFISQMGGGNLSMFASIIVFNPDLNAKLGDIALPFGVAYCNYTFENNSQCDWRGAMTISPQDNAFFWVGDKGIAVVPIPAALMPAAVAPLRLRPARH